jgi:hypothetical protein
MAGHGACINPNVKKALLEKLEEKCSIDESDVCSEVTSLIESWPECGSEKSHRAPRQQHPATFVEQTFVQNPSPPRTKRPRKLSEYQKHMSVCLLADEGFNSCIGKWKAGDSMADGYKGSGMTKAN